LSPAPGDRGSPLGEYAKLTFGRRALPRPVELGTRAAEAPAPPTDVRSIVLGGPHGEGLVELAGRRFLAEGTLPPPRAIAESLDGAAAAAALLADLPIPLDPVETQGATLAPWPANAGYLLSSAGRPLAAWQRGDDGIVVPYIDVHVLRSQALVLMPVAVAATTVLFEMMWPVFPADAYDAGANTYEVDTPTQLRASVIRVLAEDASGRRTTLRKVRLQPTGRSRIRDVVPKDLAKGARIVLVLEGQLEGGSVVVLERRLDAERAQRVVTPPPGTQPTPPAPEPPEDDAEDTDPTLPVETPPVEPPSAPPGETPQDAPVEPGDDMPDGDKIPGNRAAPPNPGTPGTPPPTSPSTKGPMTETPPDPVNPPKK
jgi:hypothetical protein